MTGTELAEHPNVTTMRTAFAAAAQGDIGPFDAMLCDDFVMINHDNGAADQSEIVGKDAFFAFYGRWLAFFEGTFTQELIGIYGDDDRVLVVMRETGRRGAAVFDNQAIYHVLLRDGRWARLETFDRDREANDRFWAAVGGPAALHATPLPG